MAEPSDPALERALASLSRDQLVDFLRSHAAKLPAWDRERIVSELKERATTPPSSSATRPLLLPLSVALALVLSGLLFAYLHSTRTSPTAVESQSSASAQVASSLPNDPIDAQSKPSRVTLSLRLLTPGAHVSLVAGTSRNAFSPDSLSQGPLNIELDTSKQWRVEAWLQGHEPLNIPLLFEQGESTRTLSIQLKPLTADAAATTVATAPSEAQPPATSTSCALNVSSIPPASVLIDGRPVGTTPRAGLAVLPGDHVVTFVHPEKGRKSVRTSIRAGETKSVAVRF